jgi:hypothetical protein
MSDPFDPTVNPSKPPRNPPPINCAVPADPPLNEDGEPLPNDDSQDD